MSPANDNRPLPVPLPANAGENTRIWFARFNAQAFDRGIAIAADLPSVAELRADARRAKDQGDEQFANHCRHQADLIETDVRLLGLHAIVGDYNCHPDRVVARMYGADFRKALYAQVQADVARAMRVAAE